MDRWKEAEEQVARKEREFSSMPSLCAEVRGFPPCKFSPDIVAQLKSLI